MRRFQGYDHPSNFDINNRPSNASLNAAFVVGLVLSAIPGAAILTLLYSLISGDPTVGWTIALASIGAAIGASIYFPANARSGRIKRREFTSAGGDPTGISIQQFGAMGGRKLDDGTWEWSTPGGSGDYV
jgi:hypothetical protein